MKIGLKPGPRGIKKSGPLRPGLKCRALKQGTKAEPTEQRTKAELEIMLEPVAQRTSGAGEEGDP